MSYKNQVFDITKKYFYNVGVRKSATYFYSASTFFLEAYGSGRVWKQLGN